MDGDKQNRDCEWYANTASPHQLTFGKVSVVKALL